MQDVKNLICSTGKKKQIVFIKELLLSSYITIFVLSNVWTGISGTHNFRGSCSRESNYAKAPANHFYSNTIKYIFANSKYYKLENLGRGWNSTGVKITSKIQQIYYFS